jgi:hypothetical protein
LGGESHFLYAQSAEKLTARGTEIVFLDSCAAPAALPASHSGGVHINGVHIGLFSLRAMNRFRGEQD